MCDCSRTTVGTVPGGGGWGGSESHFILCTHDPVRSDFCWGNSGSVHFTYLATNCKRTGGTQEEGGRLSQTSMMSHAVYARGQRVLLLPEVSSEWCSSCRDMNPVGNRSDRRNLGLIIQPAVLICQKKGTNLNKRMAQYHETLCILKPIKGQKMERKKPGKRLLLFALTGMVSLCVAPWYRGHLKLQSDRNEQVDTNVY